MKFTYSLAITPDSDKLETQKENVSRETSKPKTKTKPKTTRKRRKKNEDK